MNSSTLWSLRLGYSGKQAQAITNLGLSKFLELSFQSKFETTIPHFLDESPKSFDDFKTIKKKRKENPEEIKMLIRQEVQVSQEMKSWWIDKIKNDEYPLREKMTCFWHNHYVSTFQKVKVNYWIFQHNQILRENAFGNFKELTKKIVKSNAMVRYLDNTDNRKGKLNENLSRELLELFTLGIGNYSENDIKNGAKGLAGLGIGPENAVYRQLFEDDESFTYLTKNGNLKIEAMVDTIFEQPAIPYLLTKKILQWFIYDHPTEALIKYYGDYFRKVDYEIKPLLIKIFTEEYIKDNAGSKIKNPLEFILQLLDELHIENTNNKPIAFFIKQQGMDLFNQPNVKGWDGGNAWLTSQSFLQRNTVADLLCNGKNFGRKNKKKENSDRMEQSEETNNQLQKVKLVWDKKGNNKEIIAQLKDRLLFQTDENLQQDFEKILKYDFDSTTEGSENAILRLFNAMVKTPEFQLI